MKVNITKLTISQKNLSFVKQYYETFHFTLSKLVEIKKDCLI
jgi:hypothetical protein